MTFQFLCPQGHLLQGEEAHMGMQCQCPQCGMAFIIPVVERPEQPAAVYTQPFQEGIEPLGLVPLDEPKQHAPVVKKTAPVPKVDFTELGVGELGEAAAAEVLLHIPCPNGHELETPPDMIGQRVLCPQCKVEFRLRREKSIEYLHQQEILDRQRARFWFQLAIVAMCFVGVVLLAIFGMMIFS